MDPLINPSPSPLFFDSFKRKLGNDFKNVYTNSMGRSGGKNRVSKSSNLSRSDLYKNQNLNEYLSLDRSGQFEGDVVNFSKEGSLTLTAGDPGLTIAGMAEVDSVSYMHDQGLWEVVFEGGEKAWVDLESMSVQGPDNQSLCRGALAMALAENALLSDSSTPAEQALSDLHRRLKEIDDPESFRNRAIAALAVIEDSGIAPNLDDPSIALEEGTEPEDFDPRSYQSPHRDLKQLAEALSEIRSGGDGHKHGIDDSLAILGRLTEDPEEGARFEKQEDVFWKGALALANYDEEAAKKLIPDSDIMMIEVPKKDEDGNPIYILDEDDNKIPHLDDEGAPVTDVSGNVMYQCEPEIDSEGVPVYQNIGSFDLDDDASEKLKQIDRAIRTQSRFFLSLGRPGTGKNALEEQYAALVRAPYTEFVFNGETDMHILVGGDGLEYKPAYNKDGDIVGGGSESVVVEGPLARALAQPGMTSLQEVIEKSADFTMLNAALGSDVANPEKRILTISSTKGDFSYEVHPDHYIFASFNQGAEDNRMEASTHERAGLNLVYDVPPPEVFAKRLGKMVENVMVRGQMTPEPLKKAYDAKDMLPFAQVREALTDAHETGNDDFVMSPEPRTMTRAINQFILSAYEGDADPLKKFRNSFHYCLRTSDDKDYEYRDDLISKMITQQEAPLKRLAESIANLNPRNKKKAEKEAESKDGD